MGNSVIGATVQQAQDALHDDQMKLFGSRFAGLRLAAIGMAAIAAMPDATADQVKLSQREFHKASDALAPFKRILDAYLMQWFLPDDLVERANKPHKALDGEKDIHLSRRQRRTATQIVTDFMEAAESKPFFEAATREQAVQIAKSPPEPNRAIAEAVLQTAGERRFFHWELQFPEAFYEPRSGMKQTVERMENPGFDAVVGNPPFLDKKKITKALSVEDDFWQNTAWSTASGIYDLYMLFVERAIHVARPDGTVGLVTPIPWLSQSEGGRLRQLVRASGQLSLRDYSYGQHFDSAIVKVVAAVLAKGIAANKAVTIVSNEGFLRHLQQSDIDEVLGGQLRVDVPETYLSVLRKIRFASVPLSSLYTPTFGLRACSRQAGGFEKTYFLRASAQECRCPVRYIEAEDIVEGQIQWKGRWLDYQPELIYSPRTPSLFESPKVVMPSLLGRRRLLAVYDTDGYYADQSLVCISDSYHLPPSAVARIPMVELAFQLVTSVVSFYFAHAIVAEALGGGAIHATPGVIARLPAFPTVAQHPRASDVDTAIMDVCEFSQAERRIVSNWWEATHANERDS